jgi:MFS family permease
MTTSISFLLRCRTFRFVSLAGATQAFVGYAIQGWTPAFFERSYGLSSTEIGLNMGLAAGIGGLLGTLPGGFLSDKLAKTDLRWYTWLSSLGMFTGTAAIAYVYMAGEPRIAFISFGVACGLLNVCLGPMFAVTQGIAPVHMRASATALLYFVINIIGMGLGTVTVGAISDLLNATYGEAEGLRMALIFVCISPVISGFLFWKAAGSIDKDFATDHPGKKK